LSVSGGFGGGSTITFKWNKGEGGESKKDPSMRKNKVFFRLPEERSGGRWVRHGEERMAAVGGVWIVKKKTRLCDTTSPGGRNRSENRVSIR